MTTRPRHAITVRNQQRTRLVRAAMLRRIVAETLADLGVVESELCFHLVTPQEMAKVNWQFLKHEGSTDVITFDHSDNPPRKPCSPEHLHGEIFISIADAVKQAREFGTSWQEELARYAIHGILHLIGHDDRKAGVRREMKQEENRLMKLMVGRFDVRKRISKSRRSSRVNARA